MRLDNKVAVVTGAASGIGKEIARTFVREGAKVAIADLNQAGADSTATELGGSDRRAIGVAMDVTSEQQVEAGMAQTVKTFGRLDILVSNAGITRDQLMLRMKRSDWDEVVATNLTASFTLCQAALKPMIRARSGRIVAISSVVGQMGNAGQANYAASKAGLIGFCKSLAREVASRQVTVNVVAPGLVETDMTKAITEAAKTDWSAQIPLGRMGSPADIAAAVSFLASDEASYITGQVLAVNGGMYM